MPIVEQQWGHIVVSSGFESVSTAQTVRFNRGNISAEIALSSAGKGSASNSQLAQARITEVFSSAGVEQPMVSVIGRPGMNMITFSVLAFNGAAIARWIVNRWE